MLIWGVAPTINEISNATISIENLEDGDISFYVEVLTKSNEVLKTDSVNGTLDDYMEYLKEEEIKEILTATLCYVLSDTDDDELNRLKISSLAFAVYSITHDVGKELADDMGI